MKFAPPPPLSCCGSCGCHGHIKWRAGKFEQPQKQQPLSFLALPHHSASVEESSLYKTPEEAAVTTESLKEQLQLLHNRLISLWVFKTQAIVFWTEVCVQQIKRPSVVFSCAWIHTPFDWLFVTIHRPCRMVVTYRLCTLPLRQYQPRLAPAPHYPRVMSAKHDGWISSRLAHSPRIEEKWFSIKLMLHFLKVWCCDMKNKRRSCRTCRDGEVVKPQVARPSVGVHPSAPFW